MHKQIYLLDGYNVIHRVSRWARALDVSLEQGRELLLGYCRRWLQQRRDVWLFLVVFDGDMTPYSQHMSAGQGIRLVYTRTDKTADDKILDLIKEYGSGYRYVVVSEDRYVINSARGLDAEVMTPADFAKVLERIPDKSSSSTRGQVRKISTSSDVDNRGSHLAAGKVTPGEAKTITDSLMREWDV